MPDPMESIAEEAKAGGTTAEGEVVPQGPSFGERFGTLFLPCPEDPLAHAGGVSRFINGRLSERSGVEAAEIHVGENVAHCVDHLFPGSGTLGMPPIVNLARSVMAYRDKASKNSDELVRR